MAKKTEEKPNEEQLDTRELDNEELIRENAAKAEEEQPEEEKHKAGTTKESYVYKGEILPAGSKIPDGLKLAGKDLEK